jgi:hypothetical protein
MEGKTEHRWIKNDKRDSLPGIIFTSSYMEFNQDNADPGSSTQMAYSTNLICPHIPSGTDRTQILHGDSKGI